MPYITKELRGLINGYIRNITNIIKRKPELRNPMVAYVLYKILMDLYTNLNWDYKSDALKVLEDVKLEFYRRILVPYADKKIKENGDIT
jgi:hypothetical protein